MTDKLLSERISAFQKKISTQWEENKGNFMGLDREKRGKILKFLLDKKLNKTEIQNFLNCSEGFLEGILLKKEKEELISE
ncbi:MAG: hypothetical protein KAS63_10750 [Candidatus Heimdallarchaeota archaeon]|nr:hypothetical protein [Candidatus Heimdallarchaeota archaeon]MCK4955834.1 hypothetical protein [Candidatus Heimdallarchaeota archaeon]